LIDMIIRIYQVTVGGMSIRERFCSSLFLPGDAYRVSQKSGAADS